MKTIELARELGHAIQAEESYKAVAFASEAIDADNELSEKIAEFSAKQASVTEDMTEQAYEKLNSELQGMYEEITSHPKMVAFEEARAEFGALMERVMAIVTKSANGEDPETAEPDACGHDCCSCGHDHGDHECSCGHDHGDHECSCGHDHGNGGCSCGNH